MAGDFIPEARISNAAYNLLVDYGQKHGVVKAPPVPVEEIMEIYFDLSFGLRDLSEEMKANILGAIDIKAKKVFVDYQLDPHNFPKQLGRYHFTITHELGHWVLHRHDVLQGQPLFDGNPGLICRDTKKKPPKEIQADKFAAHLLMPDELVRSVWPDINGSNDPYIAVDEIADKKRKFNITGDQLPTVDIAKKMASVFNASGMAMQFRLISLGLVLTKRPEPTLF